MKNKSKQDKTASDWIGNDRSYAGVNRQRWNEKMKEEDARYVPGQKDNRQAEKE